MLGGEEASTEVGRRSRHLPEEAKSESKDKSLPKETTRRNRASRTEERNKTRKLVTEYQQESESEFQQKSEEESQQESGDRGRKLDDSR